MSVTINGTNGLTFNDNTTQATSPFAGGLGFRNRIINGAMVIDQRNNGASVTNGGTKSYSLDRWFIQGASSSKFTAQQNAGAVTPPSGFRNYLGITSSAATSLGASDYYLTGQSVEGFNVSDLGWGAAGAQSIALSFWVRSSLTGTLSGAIRNESANRSYPFTYTISAANTWEYKTVVIPGDTTGTWATTSGVGIDLNFNLGAGSSFAGTANTWASGNFIAATGSVNPVSTNGATFYITGVQLEKGSTATAFDYRPYGTELQLCQRYYAKILVSAGAYSAIGTGRVDTATLGSIYIKYPCSMRSSPTMTQSGMAFQYAGGSITAVSSVYALYAGIDSALAQFASSTASMTAGQSVMLIGNNNTSAFVDFAAEL